MIYLFGMSHAINVLRAVSAEPLSFTHENWSTMQSDGRFFSMPTKPGVFPNDLLNVFVVSPGFGWGLVADFGVTPEGNRQVVAVDGYIKLLQTLESEQTGNSLVTFIHGNELSGLSLVQHAQPYDFNWPPDSAEPLQAGFRPIPLDVVRKQMTHALRHTLASLTMARYFLPKMRILHVVPPPPIASEEQLMNKPEIFLAAIKAAGMNPLSIRVKYYQLMLEIMQESLAPLNVELTPPPSGAVTADGALKENFVYGATHANEAYGTLVAAQIAAFHG